MVENGAKVHEISSLGANQDVRIRDAYRVAARQGGEIVSDYTRHVAASGGLKEHNILGLMTEIPEGGRPKPIDFDVYKIPLRGPNHTDKVSKAYKSAAAKLGGRIIAQHTLAVDTRGGLLGHDALYLVGEFEIRRRSRGLRSSPQYGK